MFWYVLSTNTLHIRDTILDVCIIIIITVIHNKKNG